MPKEAHIMSFTTWVRAQDAYGQFDVPEGARLRDGVTLVKSYPKHIGLAGRPGKPFVNIGIAAADGYKGLTKQDLYDEIDRRNEIALLPSEAIEIPSGKPSVNTLVNLLQAHDAAGEEAAAAAVEAGGIDPTEADTTDSSDNQSDTGENTNTTTDAEDTRQGQE
jgi:hypothetical protein